MKIEKLLVRNVTSYKDETEFLIDPRLNILIGPNGGGKSNAQRILGVVITQFLFHQYDFRKKGPQSSITPIQAWNTDQLQQELDKYQGDDDQR